MEISESILSAIRSMKDLGGYLSKNLLTVFERFINTEELVEARITPVHKKGKKDKGKNNH